MIRLESFGLNNGTGLCLSDFKDVKDISIDAKSPNKATVMWTISTLFETIIDLRLNRPNQYCNSC